MAEPGPDGRQEPRNDAVGGAGAGGRSAAAGVDAERLSAGVGGFAGVRSTGEEPAALRALCAGRRRRRAARDPDPAAGLSAVPGSMFQALRHGELRGGGLCADRAGADRLRAAGGFRARDRVPQGGAVDAVAGGAVPVHGVLCGGSADGDAYIVCHCLGDVGSGPVPCASGVGECAVVYAGGELCGAAQAGWGPGCGGPGAGAGGGAGTRCDFTGKAGAHGGGLRFAGAAAVWGLGGQELARLPCLRTAGAALCHRPRRRYLSRLAALGKDLVPGLCFHLRCVLADAGQPAGAEQAAQPGLRLARAVCRDSRAGGRLQRQRERAGYYAGVGCALRAASRGTDCGAPATLLPLAAAGTGGRYVAAAEGGKPAHRRGLVGLWASQRRDALQSGATRG